tara:strand:- start:71 stop:616 length:546 start_codon:yes stop_codon:yes gene_type:complete
MKKYNRLFRFLFISFTVTLTFGCSQIDIFLDKGLSNQYKFFQSTEKIDDEIGNEKDRIKHLIPTVQRRKWNRNDGIQVIFYPVSLARYKFNGWRIGPYLEWTFLESLGPPGDWGYKYYVSTIVRANCADYTFSYHGSTGWWLGDLVQRRGWLFGYKANNTKKSFNTDIKRVLDEFCPLIYR